MRLTAEYLLSLVACQLPGNPVGASQPRKGINKLGRGEFSLNIKIKLPVVFNIFGDNSQIKFYCLESTSQIIIIKKIQTEMSNSAGEKKRKGLTVRCQLN